MTSTPLPKLLWSPPDPANTHMTAFRLHIASKFQVALPDYEALYKWSIAHLGAFWAEVWEWESGDPGHGEGGVHRGFVASRKWDEVIDLALPMDSITPWFTGARLNWAENMLRNRSATKTALIECSEPPLGEKMSYTHLSQLDLFTQVQDVSLALCALGLQPGQILGYYGPTSTASVVLLLAASSIGAIWSSSSADFSPSGVLERFAQFGDRLWGVFGVESVRYNGKVLLQREKLESVVEGLERKGVKVVVGVVDYLRLGRGGVEGKKKNGWWKWEDLKEMGRSAREKKGEGAEMEFWQGEFGAPLWVLFSSGTTGKPKPIVHRAGGMLIQSKKEHVLHGNMGPDDVFFYYTTPAWMMYNYLVAGLQTGAAIVLFDGSPLFRPELLWDMAEDLGVTVFGTSAKYIDVLSRNYSPKEHHSYPKLRQVLSTGSPLRAELFEWVYSDIKADLLLGSITGGTDLCSLFAGHNAALPVYEGEIQCIALGMAIEAWGEDGKEVPRGEKGDLVAVQPFPCMPAYFWGDPDGARYRASYFDKFEGVWAHGDFCIITESRDGNGGGLTMLGRSDGVLNPSGVRFGSSELYEVIDTLAPGSDSPTGVPSPFQVVVDSLAIGQKIQGGSDERVVLFVQLIEGALLDDALVKEIKLRVRTLLSARHSPERIIQVADVPHTVNGKKVEVPIRRLIEGAPLSTINLATLRNPECLAEYVTLGSMLRKEVE